MDRTSGVCLGSWGVTLLGLLALPLATFAAGPAATTQTAPAWHTVAELTEAERALVDL